MFNESTNLMEQCLMCCKSHNLFRLPLVNFEKRAGARFLYKLRGIIISVSTRLLRNITRGNAFNISTNHTFANNCGAIYAETNH